jgi:uncharacterized protein (TIGR04255 family)
MNSDAVIKLRNPPIVEAVLDVDCDPPPGFDLAAIEAAARVRFTDRYPKIRRQFVQGFRIEAKQNEVSSTSTEHAVQALQFLQEDERQLVQLRAQGFSFNRLAPYTHLEDYLQEIERSWRVYVNLVSPKHVRVVRLRYINRILLPLKEGKVDLDEYLKIMPRLPDEDRFNVVGFLTQQLAYEKDTGHQVSWVLTAQARESDRLSIILDITVACSANAAPSDWGKISGAIDSLRVLKNRVFFTSLTAKCIQLFQL